MNILKSIAMPFLWIASKVETMDSWLFTDEERAPMGFIYLFFINILVSTVICLFVLSVVGVL
tara:strand:- start:112 stop:297 length:186 start_codon:yes stop_codon:yes gene_type:complete